MKIRLFSIVFLLCSLPMLAMEKSTELIAVDILSGIHIIDNEALIGPKLDRSARDTFRCTCKKYLNIIPSQDELNKKYTEAYVVEDGAYVLKDESAMIKWKNLGGIFPHQEFANALKNKKENLAKWLLEQEKVPVMMAYCANMADAASSSTVKEMLPVMKWLFNTRKLKIDGDQVMVRFMCGYFYADEFIKASAYAKKLVNKYPEAQQFIDLIREFKDGADHLAWRSLMGSVSCDDDVWLKNRQLKESEDNSVTSSEEDQDYDV